VLKLASATNWDAGENEKVLNPAELTKGKLTKAIGDDTVDQYDPPRPSDVSAVNAGGEGITLIVFKVIVS
jgi:hypothetical protein